MRFASSPVRLVGAACGLGSPDSRCAEGPDALRAAGALERVERSRPDCKWDATLRCAPATGDPFDTIGELCVRLARSTSSIAQAGALPVVFTGDHSCAVGAWSGIGRALEPRGPLGLVWIDAHLDSHTPATSPTGAINGMPLAALLGLGDARLVNCDRPGAKIRASNLCIVGARSYEAEELRLLASLGVRIFFMPEVSRRGIDAVIRDAIELARSGTAGFGLSIDVDVIDPREAPGVGTPATGGVSAAGLCAALHAAGHHPDLAGIEISEYNPSRDPEGRTARIVMDLLDTLFENRARA